MRGRMTLTLALALATGLATALAAPASAATAVTADPVILLVGSERDGTDCRALFGRMADHLRKPFAVDNRRFQIPSVTTLGVHAGDTGCDANLQVGGADGTEGIARALSAWLVRNHPRGADVVAHGTGGVVLRYALMQANPATAVPDWPKPLIVRDAISVAAPHAGSEAIPSLCIRRTVCQEMAPGSPVLARLRSKTGMSAQGQGGTEWSAIGFAGDRVVSDGSATDFDAAHKTVYRERIEPYTHDGALQDDSVKEDAKITYQHAPATDWAEFNKARHVVWRVAHSLVLREGGEPGTGARAPGCVGFNESSRGATLIHAPTLAQWPGASGDVRLVRFGLVDAVATCFRKVDDGYASEGPVRVNGIDLVPRAGTKIIIHPKTRRLAAPSASVSIPLADGVKRALEFAKATPPSRLDVREESEIDWVLPDAGDPLKKRNGDIVSLSTGALRRIAGLAFKSAFSVKFVQGGIDLQITLSVPDFLSGGVTLSDDAAANPECGNHRDDDGDGKTDFWQPNPADADPDCDSRQDDSEAHSKTVGGGVTIGTTNERGLLFSKLELTVSSGLGLGGLNSRGVAAQFTWENTRDDAYGRWTVKFDAGLPFFKKPGSGIAFEVIFRWTDEGYKLVKLAGEIKGIGFPLHPPWQLYGQRFRLSADQLDTLDPKYAIGIGISFMKRFYFLGDAAPIELDGDLSWTSSLSEIKLSGKGKLAGFDVAEGALTIEPAKGAGRLDFKVGVVKDLVLKPLGVDLFSGRVKAIVDFAGTLGAAGLFAKSMTELCAEGSITKLRVKFETTCALQGAIRFSAFKDKPLVLSFCVGLPSFDEGGSLKVGVAYTFTQDGPVRQDSSLFGNCDVDAAHERARLSAAGDPAVLVPRGSPTEVIALHGDTVPPVADLVGPQNRRVDVPTDGRQGPVDGGYVLRDEIGAVTYVVLHRPAPGRWTIEPEPGSAPLREVASASALPPVTAEGRVRRLSGGRVRLSYDVAAAPGERVLLSERRGGIESPIAEVRPGRGSVTFRPAPPYGAVRRVRAKVVRDGELRAERTVLRYRAPALAAPGRARGIRIRRSGGRLVITWGAAPRAHRYIAVVQAPDGRTFRREIGPGARRRVVIPEVRAEGRARIEVVALRRGDGLQGPIARAVGTGNPRREHG